MTLWDCLNFGYDESLAKERENAGLNDFKDWAIVTALGCVSCCAFILHGCGDENNFHKFSDLPQTGGS